jgi:hypothetical protein
MVSIVKAGQHWGRRCLEFGLLHKQILWQECSPSSFRGWLWSWETSGWWGSGTGMGRPAIKGCYQVRTMVTGVCSVVLLGVLRAVWHTTLSIAHLRDESCSQHQYFPPYFSHATNPCSVGFRRSLRKRRVRVSSWKLAVYMEIVRLTGCGWLYL